MKKTIFAATIAAALGVAAPAQADLFSVSVPQPVQTYTVCNYGAKMVVNTRAVPVSAGQRNVAINGNQAVISRSPDVFIQQERIVRNAYVGLSASGNCGPF